jgi:hypothetical protein
MVYTTSLVGWLVGWLVVVGQTISHFRFGDLTSTTKRRTWPLLVGTNGCNEGVNRPGSNSSLASFRTLIDKYPGTLFFCRCSLTSCSKMNSSPQLRKSLKSSSCVIVVNAPDSSNNGAEVQTKGWKMTPSR